MELAAENLPSFYSSVPQTFLSVTRSSDALGRPDAVALKVGQTSLSATQYAYDPTTGRLASVAASGSPQSPVSSFQYTPNSDLLEKITRTSSNLPPSEEPPGRQVLESVTAYEPYRNLISSVSHSVLSVPSVVNLSSYSYINDEIARRTTMARGGTAFAAPDVITYGYNDRSEVTSATSTRATGNAYDFGYQYDPIGNRTFSHEGTKTRSDYSSNALNQYESRTVPGSFDLTGTANPAATVVVQSPAGANSANALFPTTRLDNLWHASIPVNNGAGPVTQDAQVFAALPGSPDLTASEAFPSVFIPQTPEPYTYDLAARGTGQLWKARRPSPKVSDAGGTENSGHGKLVN